MADTDPSDRRAKVGSLLAILVAGIGDTVLGVPALRALRAGFPGAHISLLGRHPPLELLEGCPYVDQLIPFDLLRFKARRWAWRPTVWRDLGRSLRPLRARHFDLAANLYLIGTRAGGIRMAALLGWIGAPVTAGWRSPFGVPRYRITAEPSTHVLDSQVNVARALGAPAAGTHLELWIGQSQRAASTAFLAECGIDPSAPLVCVHPGSARPEARWPVAGFAAVGARLAAVGAHVVVTGGPEERALAEAVAAGSRARTAVAAGKLRLGALAALLERATLLVTNDSGPMHIAAAVGCPLVVPFGPADPKAFGPRGNPEITRVLVPNSSGPWNEAAWLRVMPPARVAAEAEALLASVRDRVGRVP